MSAQSSAVVKPKKQLGFWRQVWRQKQLVILSLPVIFVILFNYVPLWGWLVAFFNYKPTTGFNVFANEFRGLEYFQALFQDEYFWRGLKNSLGMGVLKIIFSYVFSLMLAVMINEVRVSWFKRTVQTISYLPHFVSWGCRGEPDLRHLLAGQRHRQRGPSGAGHHRQPDLLHGHAEPVLADGGPGGRLEERGL